MADEEHLQILRQGVTAWNRWREKNPDIKANLYGADLRKAHLRKANLSEAILIEADLTEADLREADLSKAILALAYLQGAKLQGAKLQGANLQGAKFQEANLQEANLQGADLRGADLRIVFLQRANLLYADLQGADLSASDLSGADLQRAKLQKANLQGAILDGANLRDANLQGADLRGALLYGTQLISTDLCDATLTGSRVHGVSVWDIKVNERTQQQNLIIAKPDSLREVWPEDLFITVDDIEVAQFIYLLLNNQAIRKVIDTITSKAVLILGRFSKERKPVLDAIRDELRKHDYLPIMFDFDPTTNQTISETVKTLAEMSRFVIADLTDARSVPQELQIIDTHCRTVAVRLIKKRGEPEYGMLDFKNSPWFVKGRYEYENTEELIASIKENIIGAAEAKVKELRQSN